MPTIGIFDSGIGGLTVLCALKKVLPSESFNYLGDTARLPYGSKSPETIRRYLSQNIDFLEHQGVKALVVACNSASTVLREEHWAGRPIYGVIGPGSKKALDMTRNGRIGILGTRATVTSGAYVDALNAMEPEVYAVQQECPLLVPLVEEGWIDDPVTRQVLQRYLEAPLAEGVDTLILGCTHYPVLKPLVRELVGDSVALVDSAEAIAQLILADLSSGRIIHADEPPRTRIWTTDIGKTFRSVGEHILHPFSIDEWNLADLK
ncbi:MAG: glutamate racemase [Acidobacteriota bacterium]|nr:glutamate racemase [Acidobacteriota bacterium]